MSRVDSIFREGGGAETFAAMEAEVVALHQHHPNATAWLSPCGLDEVALVSAKKRPCLQFLQLLLLLRLLLLLFSKFDDLPRQVRDKRKKNPGGKHGLPHRMAGLQQWTPPQHEPGCTVLPTAQAYTSHRSSLWSACLLGTRCGSTQVRTRHFLCPPT